MKKIFGILCLAALTLTACSSEDNPNGGGNGGGGNNGAPSYGTGSIVFGYCAKEINFTTGINSANGSGTVGGAIYIPQSQAQAWKGNSISAFIVGFGTSETPEAQLFISEGQMDGIDMPPYVYTQEAVMELQNDWNEITLDTPYEITGETGFYVGYTTPMNFGDRPLALDANMTEDEEDYGSIIGVFRGGDDDGWVYAGPWFGRICLQIEISGDHLPLYNVEISDLYVPEFVKAGEEFTSDFYLTNIGIDPVTSVEISLSVNGKVVSTGIAQAESPIQTGETGWLTAKGLVIEETGVDMDVVATVTKINDTDDILVSGDSKATGEISCSDISYVQNVAIEEFTGTWCGWCPRGIVGMEYMREHYADQGFVPIAGHSGDEMVSQTYAEVVNTFSNGSFPSAVANRSYYFDPSADTMEEYFLYLKRYPAYAQVSLDCSYVADEGKVAVNATTEFAFDYTNASFEICFVVCQNNVGPYIQTNYFATNKDAEGGGDWYDYPSAVAWTYDEVARQCSGPFGVANSVPASITKGTPYTYSLNMTVGDGSIEDYYVVALLLDTSTYRVVNCAKYDFGATKASRSSSEKKNVKIDTEKIRKSAI